MTGWRWPWQWQAPWRTFTTSWCTATPTAAERYTRGHGPGALYQDDGEKGAVYWDRGETYLDMPQQAWAKGGWQPDRDDASSTLSVRAGSTAQGATLAFQGPHVASHVAQPTGRHVA